MQIAEFEVFKGQSQRPSAYVPSLDMSGLRVLDIGCGTGKDLMHPSYACARSRYGVDVDAEMIARGRVLYPELRLAQSAAESLPFPDNYFHVVVSHVALPYTNIPIALREISRVMCTGGLLYVLMHDWRQQLGWLVKGIRDGAYKRVIDNIYVFAASAAYGLSGRVPAKPWNGRRETFQTSWRFTRSLEGAGFGLVDIDRQRGRFIVTAVAGDPDIIINLRRFTRLRVGVARRRNR